MLVRLVTITTMCSAMSKVQFKFTKQRIQKIAQWQTHTIFTLKTTGKQLFTFLTLKMFNRLNKLSLINVMMTTMVTFLLKNMQTMHFSTIIQIYQISGTTKMFRNALLILSKCITNLINIQGR
jgi:hypothetical protein